MYLKNDFKTLLFTLLIFVQESGRYLRHNAIKLQKRLLYSSARTGLSRLCALAYGIRRVIAFSYKMLLKLIACLSIKYNRFSAITRRKILGALISYEEAFNVLRDLLRSNKRIVSCSVACAVCLLIGGSAYNANATFFEYSIDGTVLGIVKDETRVVNTIDRVGAPLDPDNKDQIAIDTGHGETVVVDKSEDIIVEKKIVPLNADPVEVDSDREIVEKISNLEDVNVVSYTLSVNGSFYGTFDSIETGQALIDDAKTELLAGKNPERLKVVMFIDDIDFVQTVMPKNELSDPDTVYKEIMESKTSTLHLKTVEEIEYNETYQLKPEYNDTNRLYEGEEIVQSKPVPGRHHVTADLIRMNGEKVAEEILSTKALNKSVPAEIMRGTKKMPQKIGKGWYSWPAGGAVVSGFKYRWGKHHDGIDIDIKYGSVYAADAGTVTFAGNRGDGYGNKIIISHGGGRETLYAHLSKMDAKVGELVYQGQYIGLTGNTGSSTGPHLHFEVHLGGVPKNPLDYL